MTTIVLTGFEPFAGDPVNPSGEAVRLVAAGWDRPETLVAEILPVTFVDAAEGLRALVERHRPDVVIATGLSGGRTAVGVERIAVNLVDAPIPDNAGGQPVDQQSVAGAPPAHFATLPVKAIARAIAAAGVPAQVSLSAGTFVCNHTFFTTMDAAPAGTRAGFVHVPWSTEHAPEGAPAVPLADLARALRIAIDVSLDDPREAGVAADAAGAADLLGAGGALH